jgi:iron complex outermembrane recepter protein
MGWCTDPAARFLRRGLLKMAWKALFCAAGLALTLPAMAVADSARFDIAAQPLPAALKTFATQAHMQLLYQYSAVASARGNAVNGDLEKHVALEQLLKNSGLEVIYSSDSVATIRPVHTSAVSSAKGDDSPEGSAQTPQPLGDSPQLAQVDQGQTSSPSTVEKANDRSSEKKKTEQLEEVIVTGSRIPTTAKEGSQEIKIYTREQIEQSGQTTITDFLNGLPDVSVGVSETDNSTFGRATSVRLHGLPLGTTLVLLNGRRVETSGLTSGVGDVFDLNNIPISAVERIEVLPVGASAIYGSDAIAGVVNIILKQNFDGAELNVQFGGASDTHDTTASAAFGRRWDQANVSVVATYYDRSELVGADRAITANQDYTQFGGIDARVNYCDPGNVFSTNGANLPGLNAPYAAVPNGFKGTPSLAEFASTAGTLNACSLSRYNSLYPETRRESLLASAQYQISPSVEVFTEALGSYLQEDTWTFPAFLYGSPGFQIFTVAPSNPFNPFGQTAGVGDLLSAVGREGELNHTMYLRGVAGVRGDFSDGWHWEIATMVSHDKTIFENTNTPNYTAIQAALNSTNPATALDPFVAGAAQGSSALLSSLVQSGSETFSGQANSVTAFVRGNVLQLPGGALQVVLGTEGERDGLTSNTGDLPGVTPDVELSFDRKIYSVFGEARLPLLRGDGSTELLTATVADRYDHYSDFGGTSNPQFGVELHPETSIAIRGSFGRSFKAPTLASLYYPTQTFPVEIVDPARGNAVETPTQVFGGNPNLRPETGDSLTFGVAYAAAGDSGPQAGVTYWQVTERNNIQSLSTQIIIDNASLFPGAITRAPSVGGQLGPITSINLSEVNFGEIDVHGIDYELSYGIPSVLGRFRPFLGATQTLSYKAALTPMSSAVQSAGTAQDTGDWAPKWKGNLGVSWSQKTVSAIATARYTSHYQDYDRTAMIGSTWFLDANVHWGFGDRIAAQATRILNGSYIELGGVNLLNKLPEYSNYENGLAGYDATEADIRGRYIYVRLGSEW